MSNISQELMNQRLEERKQVLAFVIKELIEFKMELQISKKQKLEKVALNEIKQRIKDTKAIMELIINQIVDIKIASSVPIQGSI